MKGSLSTLTNMKDALNYPQNWRSSRVDVRSCNFWKWFESKMLNLRCDLGFSLCQLNEPQIALCLTHFGCFVGIIKNNWAKIVTFVWNSRDFPIHSGFHLNKCSRAKRNAFIVSRVRQKLNVHVSMSAFWHCVNMKPRW